MSPPYYNFKSFILLALTECPFLARYLHEVCLPSVVHRNLKSANILLDEELNPHLSDCGLAALTPNTEREVNFMDLTSHICIFRWCLVCSRYGFESRVEGNGNGNGNDLFDE